MELNKILKVKSEIEKTKIKSWLSTGNIIIDLLTREELVNAISSSKQLLNEILNVLKSKKTDDYVFNFKVNSIKSYNNKIDQLIDYYNNSDMYNKIKFTDNNINFSIPRLLEEINLEIKNINYNYPIDIKLKFTKDTSEIYEEYVIPYNYNGIYQEYFNTTKNKTLFKVSDISMLYFYSCTYNSNGLNVGNILDYKLNKDYFIDENGFLFFDRNIIGNNEIIIKYIPAYDGYDIKINGKISKVEMIIENDFLNIVTFSEKNLIIK